MSIITSNIDRDVTTFYLVTDDNNIIESMRWVKKSADGRIISDSSATARQVMNGGVVIEERDGFEAVRLEVEKFTVTNGGTIRLNYLYNAITGSRKIDRLLLLKADNTFHLTNLTQQRINHLFLAANWSRTFGVIGIREILTSWSNTAPFQFM